MRILTLVGLLALPACDLLDKSDDDTGPGADGDSDTDGDGDSDTDGDGDTDADTDSDSDADVDVDCEQDLTPQPVDEDSCVTASIACGETLTDTIEGGLSMVDGSDYASSWACAVVGSSNYGGAERMYSFEHPGKGNATITLESPCSELDLFAAYWEAEDECLRSGVSILECEGNIDSGGGSVTIWNNEPRRYILVVDGPDEEEDVFGLAVSCDW